MRYPHFPSTSKRFSSYQIVSCTLSPMWLFWGSLFTALTQTLGCLKLTYSQYQPGFFESHWNDLFKCLALSNHWCIYEIRGYFLRHNSDDLFNNEFLFNDFGSHVCLLIQKSLIILFQSITKTVSSDFCELFRRCT